MTELTDVLEAVHESRSRIRTLRARGLRDDAEWRLWWAGPQRIRTEMRRDEELHVLVQDGTRWWVSGPGRFATNEGREDAIVGFGPELEVLNTLPFLGESVLDLMGEDRVAGRPAALLRARPRGRIEGSELFRGENESFEIAIDLERGVLLRGRSIEVTEIAFDEDVDENVFAAPPPPADFREPLSPPFPRRITWDERADVGFPIWMPTLLPEGARPLHGQLSGDHPPAWIELVWAIDPGFRYRLQIRQGPGLGEEASLQRWPPEPEGEPHVVERAGGQTFRSFSVVVREGPAWFEITSDLPLELVLRIAASIEVGA